MLAHKDSPDELVTKADGKKWKWHNIYVIAQIDEENRGDSRNDGQGSTAERLRKSAKA